MADGRTGRTGGDPGDGPAAESAAATGGPGRSRRRRRGRKVGPADGAEVARALVVYQPHGRRSSTFRPEIADAIVEAVRRGAYRSTAAAAVGVPSSTLAGWIKRGALDLSMAQEAIEAGMTVRLSEFADFVLRLSAAEARYEIDLTALIDAHGLNDWRALAWRLERTRPDRYGRRDRLQVEVRRLVREAAAAEGVDEAELLAEVASMMRGR